MARFELRTIMRRISSAMRHRSRPMTIDGIRAVEALPVGQYSQRMIRDDLAIRRCPGLKFIDADCTVMGPLVPTTEPVSRRTPVLSSLVPMPPVPVTAMAPPSDWRIAFEPSLTP